MKKVVVMLAVGMLAGCNTVPLQNTYPKEALFCPKRTVEVCTGRNPRMMECQCVRTEILERELRKLTF